MSGLRFVLLIGLGLFVLLVVGMNLFVRWQARAMRGRAVPPLPGPWNDRVGAEPHLLLYFMSPSCGACRALTPKLRALESAGKKVRVVDVTQSLELARALGVMATPSTFEIDSGRIVDVHVGGLPTAVYERFAS